MQSDGIDSDSNEYNLYAIMIDLYWVINDFLHVFNACTSSGELKDLLGTKKNLLKDVYDNHRE